MLFLVPDFLRLYWSWCFHDVAPGSAQCVPWLLSPPPQVPNEPGAILNTPIFQKRLLRF